MLVKYNAVGGTMIIPFSDLDEETTKQKGSVRGKSPIALLPGWNEIAIEDFPYLEGTMEDGVKAGTYEYKCKEVEEEGVTKRIQLTLAEVHATTARNIVNECYNIADLERWRNDPKLSSEIRNLADIQYKKIVEYEGR